MLKSKLNICTFITGVIIMFIIAPPIAVAQGNLLVTPRRVVFDGTRRVLELNLANTGVDSSKYNVSLIQYKMNEDGSFTEITEPEPGQYFADKNIRFFPRTVTLGPNEAQVVKMQVTNTERLAAGEYRSHIYFRSVPKLTALGIDDIKKDTTSVSVQLTPVFGITIPVIIRIGVPDTKTNLSDVKFEELDDTTKVLEVKFTRTGNMSVYGDLRVVHIAPNGIETLVGSLNGVAVYTPNKTRTLRMTLSNERTINYKTGKFNISYLSQSDTRPEKYAETEFLLR
ncbi:MAG: hypothetical protein Q8R90_05540 [Bacteroidales bacterium]|nr:hypothetical protein [Bacteroidales bacterium]